MRSFNRNNHETRPVSLELDYTIHADGSVLISMGRTKVLCTAFLEDRVPPFLKGQGVGWVTAEYGMLPGSTHSRGQREAARGKQSGRTQEIQRLIGRSLRACVNASELGERSITVDCDVIQADGGTRTASVTGGSLALLLCLWKHRKKFIQPPIAARVAAVSLGIAKDKVLVDLDYEEDSSADADINLIMTSKGEIVEIQGTAERASFSKERLLEVVDLGSAAIDTLLSKQKEALSAYGVDEGWLL